MAYISRVLYSSEKKYIIAEKEGLTALWAMENFNIIYMVKKFTFITDHKAIEEIKTKPEFGSSGIKRWFARLKRFNLQIEYSKDDNILISDALSRRLCFVEIDKVNEKDNI